jgi:hypothetical protein
MKQLIAGVLFVALATVAVSPAAVRAQTTTATTDVSSLITLLQSLMKQVEDLQKQLSSLRGEVREVRAELRDGLREGVENDDVKKIQELLATDPAIYPKGLVSGYYGPLTKEAVKAFQKRHSLTETGEVDTETKALLLEYFKENNGKVPPGLLRAPGIDKKIMERFKKGDDGKYYLDCDDKKGTGVLCKDKTNTEDKLKDTTTIKQRAEGMIDTATKVIADLEDKIEDAKDDDEDEDDIEDAEEDFARAKTELTSAKTYFTNKEYQKAYDEAVKAKMSAYAGIDELN